jgi:hypothetical protein
MKKSTRLEVWNWVALALAPFIVCGLSCLAAWQWFVVGCLWWECTNSRPFNSQEIQIPQEYFPSGSAYNRLHPDSELQGAIQRERQTIFWGESNDATAVLEVSRYPGVLRATNRFELELRIFSDSAGAPWARPAELTFQSASADQSFLGCGTLAGSRCVFVARYGEYLIAFDATIDDQMTLQEFKRIIEYLDIQAVSQLTR